MTPKVSAVGDSQRSAFWQAPALKIAAGLLLAGAALLPLLIFLCGVTLLGRYDGVSVVQTYRTVYAGLIAGAPSSWIVVLGPCLLFLLFLAARRWWRLGV